jgi:hypothetical protein
MKCFLKVIDPIDSLPRWYWRFEDAKRVRYEVTWHGPFALQSAAEIDAAKY